MAVYRINEETLVAMANSIRSTTGETGSIKGSDMSVEITTGNEEITAEITTYTSELSELEAQISALEAALEGKAIGTATIYKGTTEPNASIGSDGDIYLVVNE